MSEPLIRALTLWRPWPAAILAGAKDVENRPWARPTGFPPGSVIAVHAGQRWQDEAVPFIQERWPAFDADRAKHPSGVIEGLVEVIGYRRVTAAEKVGTGGNPWAFGPWVWELAHPVRLLTPIPWRGAQGLFELPIDVERQLRDAWRAAA